MNLSIKQSKSLMIIRGRDSSGKEAVYLVAPRKLSKRILTTKIKNGDAIDLDSFGEVIYSHYGTAPNEKIMELFNSEILFLKT